MNLFADRINLCRHYRESRIPHHPSSRGFLSVGALVPKSKGAVATHLSSTKRQNGLPRTHFVGARNDASLSSDFHGNGSLVGSGCYLLSSGV